MSGLGIVLISLAIADLIAGGLTGEPNRRAQIGTGLLAGALVAAILGWLVAWPLWLIILTTSLALVTSSGWILARGTSDSHSKRPHLALTWLSACLLGTLILTPLWPDVIRPGLTTWFQALPFTLTQEQTLEKFLAYLGVMLFLSAPANAFVRIALTLAGTDWQTSQKKLRGGRIIGVLERWLIFALAAAGEPTAAALIVSAKSLLRFPELNRKERSSQDPESEATEVDIVTEYFLLGSLLSWTLALGCALLMV